MIDCYSKAGLDVSQDAEVASLCFCPFGRSCSRTKNPHRVARQPGRGRRLRTSPETSVAPSGGGGSLWCQGGSFSFSSGPRSKIISGAMFTATVSYTLNVVPPHTVGEVEELEISINHRRMKGVEAGYLVKREPLDGLTSGSNWL